MPRRAVAQVRQHQGYEVVLRGRTRDTFLAFQRLKWTGDGPGDAALAAHDQINAHESANRLLANYVFAVCQLAHQSRDVLAQAGRTQINFGLLVSAVLCFFDVDGHANYQVHD